MASTMASDASRRWLGDSGILSCRIKIPHPHIHPQPQADSSRGHDLVSSQFRMAASTATMDVPLETTSPSSRRNKGKIAEALQSMGNLNSSMEELELPTDPDAQATVTDFLDFTEYLPADMTRSLTLIGNLDHRGLIASTKVNELTKQYGELPSMPADTQPSPVTLRKDISESLTDSISARTLAHAEAQRMKDNIDRHYNRASNILAKLQDMLENYPPSRESSPIPQKSKSPVATRPPKITLRLDSTRAGESGGARIRKHRAPRITVPGEVLAPYELDYETFGSESDTSESEEESITTPRATPGATLAASSGKIKLKIPKLNRDKSQKPPRGPRPPGVMGTNVHSAIAGISTSNALAKLKPPPPDAVKGDEHLPWLQLNPWELALLRKRMKKNAIWSPSDTMIARELKELGRGIEAYRKWRNECEASGKPFDTTEPPQLRGEAVHAEGAISVEAIRASEPQLSNRGMKLNEAKKLKKENQAKELAKQAAEEAEASARKMAENAKAMIGLFKEKKPPVKTPSKTPARKRKRESPLPNAEGDKTAEGDSTKAAKPALKRNKTETPVPAPLPLTTKQTPPVVPTDNAPSVASEAPLVTPIEASGDALAIPLPLLSPKKSSTPILPPVKEARKPVKKELKVPETATITRPRRTSAGAPMPSPIVPEPLTAKRPTSSRSKAGSVEPPFATPTATASIDRPRRASTARNTPAPEPRQPSKRAARRPPPGVVSASSEGGATAVSVGKRSAAPRKKAGPKKEKKNGREGSAAQELYDEVDDEGNIIDPNEPRYCLCNRVSFGSMIGCENSDNCDIEWFHLECVGLTVPPPRTTKWYCPVCRVTLGIGEKGEVNARGKKK